jgi:hypothetical protein
MHVAVAGVTCVAELIGEAVGVLVVVVMTGSAGRGGIKGGSEENLGKRSERV